MLENSAAKTQTSVHLAIGKIAEALMEEGKAGHDIAPDITLADGSAGVIVTLVELYKYLQEDFVLTRLQQEIDILIRSVEYLTSGFGLYTGLAGVSWSVNYAIEALGGSLLMVDQHCTREVDEALVASVTNLPQWNYDLISGLVGLGAWALDTTDRDLGSTAFRAVMQRLHSMSELHPNGVTWRTPADLIPENTRAIYPSGYHNLGLAHGVPGVISLIGKAVCRGMAKESDINLLRNAVSWLLSCQTKDGPLRFTFYDGYVGRSRVAWCYGDLGVSVALAQAAIALGDRGLMCDATSAAMNALSIDAPSSGVVDGLICHGALGVSHIADEFYKFTGDPRFSAYKEQWLRVTFEIAQRTPANLLFPMHVGDQDQFKQQRGYLTGISGACLAMLSLERFTSGYWNFPLLTGIESH